MNSKNTLQEYCQKRKIPLPVYNTVICDGTPTVPIFESIVSFGNDMYRATGLTKIAAEKDVARMICESLPTITPCVSQPKYKSLRSVPIESYQRVYLIDGDNCHVTNNRHFDDMSSLFIYFIAKNNTHPYPFQHQAQHPNCCVFVSDSIGRDATDHMLTFYLGQMSVMWCGKTYFIVTKDHFAECLEKIMCDCQVLCSL
jgi:hypothetical protein